MEIKGHQLRKCPFCNDENLLDFAASGLHGIMCKNCGACGPLSHDFDKAILFWNGELKPGDKLQEI